MGIEQEVKQYLHDDMGFCIEDKTLHDIIVALSGENADVEKEDFDDFACSVASRFAVHETYFLRHREQFDWLVHNWIEYFLAGNNKQTMRVLCAGCATGEEPYSVYAWLQPVLKLHEVELQVDAVDVSKTALKKARKGRYGLWSMRGVNEEDEQGWLDVHSREIQVKEWVKKGVHFEQANITRPFLQQNSGLYDLVICRNVMIYMHPGAVDAVYRNLTGLMTDNGLLMPGPSDPNPYNHSMPMRFDHGVRVFAKSGQVLDQLAHITPPETAVKKKAAQKAEIDKKNEEKIIYELARMQEEKQATLEEETNDADEQIYRMVEKLIQECKYERARKILEANTVIDPMDVRAYVWLAMMAMELGDKELESTAIRKAFFLQPDAPYVMYLRANHFKANGDTRSEKKVLNDLKQQLQNIPDDELIEYSMDITAEQLTGAVNARLG